MYTHTSTTWLHIFFCSQTQEPEMYQVLHHHCLREYQIATFYYRQWVWNYYTSIWKGWKCHWFFKQCVSGIISEMDRGHLVSSGASPLLGWWWLCSTGHGKICILTVSSFIQTLTCLLLFRFQIFFICLYIS